MIITVRQSAQPVEHRRDYWSWCFAHGFILTEVVEPITVDTERGVVTVHRLLPLSVPGDPDFPELRRDEFNHPLTETLELRLILPVPGWLVAEPAQQLAA